MSIGYACIAVGVPNTELKTCRMKNASEENLIELISHNLNSLKNIIEYNSNNNFHLFRISSDLIPFGSSLINTLSWQEIFKENFKYIGEQIASNNIRVSMHPGQYTVLNSPDSKIVERAISDLNYHAKILELLGTNEKSKIILHIGGVYNDRISAIKRFCENWDYLDINVQKRIVLENDEKSYNIAQVLELTQKLGIPAVFDNLHNSINSVDKINNEIFWINQCSKTWKEKDGTQKIHYSQQSIEGRKGSHSETINTVEFLSFYEKILSNKINIDIMLEVKDKNLSAQNCMNAISMKLKQK